MSTAPPESQPTPPVQPQPISSLPKLGGQEWWTSIGSPKYVVAPMVDQSELAWRILSRLHGATLAYTPMFHAALFSSPSHPQYCESQFDTSPTSLEGLAPYDRPLVVQFCANDKDQWLAAANKVVGRCDAVDLNLGCPQGIAKKGKYGAFLMEEWELIGGMISHLHENLALPVIAKLRIFPSLSRTLSYASHIFSSGAQLLTIHGRTREAKGRQTGLASWSSIASVRSHIPAEIPILANGGVPSAEEVEPCLNETGVQGVMSAEGNLYNPMIFSPVNAQSGREYGRCLPEEMQVALTKCDNIFSGIEWDRERPAYGPSVWLANQYLAIVRTLPGTTKTASSAIKAHLFKLFRPTWGAGKHLDLREMLGRCGGSKGSTFEERVGGYQKVADIMLERILTDVKEGHLPSNSFRPLTHDEVLTQFGGTIPYSHAQPYLRIATSEEEPSTAKVPVVNLKRTLEDVDPTEASKKLKPDSTVTIATPLPTSTLCQMGSTKQPSCPNSAAAKCSRFACRSCCVAATKTSTLTEAQAQAQAEGCFFHEEKTKRERESIMKTRRNRASAA